MQTLEDHTISTVTIPPHPPSRAHPRRRRVLRRIGSSLVVAIGLAVVLGTAGAIYETAAEAADLKAYPPPGRMVDVGGHRLHIHCMGTGSPTVVIDAGWGGWSASWSSWVQPDAAKTTRVCSYDRAGMGWSEPGPLPRTAEHFARELHILLQRAGVAGPYVLVGHSMGGLTMRTFAHAFPADVAGVVLVDSMSPSQAKPADPAPPPLAAAPASKLSILTLPARIGVLRLVSGSPEASGVSQAVANAYAAFSVTPRSVQTALDEGMGMSESFARTGAITSLGAVPLIVLSRGLDREADWDRWQTELLDLSSKSQQLIADQSGHNIEIDQPAAAVAAIVQMVGQVRGGS